MAPSPYQMKGVALITGSASGIGRSVAKIFVLEGCTRLILADLSQESLKSLAEELKALDESVKVCCVRCDVSQEADVHRMIDEGVNTFGAIHYAINNAGVSTKPRIPTAELDVSAFDRVQNINLRGVWLWERAELRQMLTQDPVLEIRSGGPAQRGSIVNISSIFARIGEFTTSPYCAAKAGVLGLSRADACAYSSRGIRVNSICPGWIRTPLVDLGIRNGTYDERVADRIPMQRWGTPEELAEAVVFLASTKASFITGEEIVVDGGSIIKSVS